MDAEKVAALTLLDFSTAFNTIDHAILLRRLDDWFRVTGKALNWFKSYLPGRCQREGTFRGRQVVYRCYGVFRMSMQSFTILVGIASKSDDLHGASRTRRLTSSAVTQVRFSWVLGYGGCFLVFLMNHKLSDLMNMVIY